MRHQLHLPTPHDGPEAFRYLKKAANEYWQEIQIGHSVYGYQIQPGAKWQEGLTEEALAEFQHEMGYVFPSVLRHYYLTMNGLDAPGVNIYGSSGHSYAYRPIYYSYPDDLEIIKEQIDWILDSNGLSSKDLPSEASRIFPIMGHRFLLIDDPKHRILSMHGNDIIYWADSLSRLLLIETFPASYYNHIAADTGNIEGIKLWLD